MKNLVVITCNLYLPINTQNVSLGVGQDGVEEVMLMSALLKQEKGQMTHFLQQFHSNDFVQ